MFRTKNSKITVYGLAKVDTPNSYLTFVSKKQDLEEYVRRFILLEHFEHYRAWCNLKNYDLESPEIEKLYFKTCIESSELNNYIVKKLKYRLKDITGILRMFGNCLPLGCSFELPYEDIYFKSKFESLENESSDENNITETSEVTNGSE